MKKYGKYEKMPDGTRAKQPPVKSMLLQTYFTSLLCLVLCVTMFFGTSYAWFTSEVNNTANEIYIGTMDVGLFAGEKDLSDSNNKLFDANIRWEPGYTALETIKVVNEGDLAFKYVLNFTDGAATNADDSEVILADVAKFFDVWVYDHRANASKTDAVADPGSYAELTAENSGWVSAGSLDELLGGKSVLDGVMVTVRNENTATPNEGTTDGVATEDTYTIALHMKEEATAAVMGQRITLNVKLIAYQMASEQDSLGGKYDQMVATEEQLREALAHGGTVSLATDIKLTDGVTVASDKTVILDLNGHKITGTASANMTSLITNNGTMTIVGNGEIAITFGGEADNSKAVNAISNRGVLTVNGGKISNTGTGNQIGYAIDNYNGATLTVNGGEITASGSSYYDGIRLFCGSSETLVVVNGGKVSTIWAQNPSANKATEVKGTVIINSGEVAKTYYENYTVVKVAEGVTAYVEAYGNGKDNTTTAAEAGYTVYSFIQSGNE